MGVGGWWEGVEGKWGREGSGGGRASGGGW